MTKKRVIVLNFTCLQRFKWSLKIASHFDGDEIHSTARITFGFCEIK